MKKNNIRLLTSEELNVFLDKYSFTVKDNFIWVDVKGFNRLTLHPISKSFSISCNNRKITIIPEAIELWNNYFKDKHLIEVQQAINKLILMYQTPKYEDVDKILNNKI